MKLREIIKTSRPRFWIYELGPFIIGIAGAWHIAYGSDVGLLLTLAVFFFYFLIPANILIYGINDIFDYETDKLNPKKVQYEKLLLPAQHRYVWWSVIITTTPFIIYAFHQNTPSIVAFCAFIFCATCYSAKPIRAKIRPGLDMLCSAAHYVFTAVFGYALLSSSFPHTSAIIAGLLWAMSMHAYSAVPDISADKESGISTIATWLGKRPTILMCGIFYSLSAIVAFQYIGFVSIVLLIPYLLIIQKSLNAKSDEEIFKLYGYFPKLNAIAGMIIFFAVAF